MKKIVLIFSFALILRLGFLAFWYQTGQGERISSDAYGYLNIATSLNEGEGFRLNGELTARRPPLYPAWIAFFLRFSSFPLGVQMGDALLGALSCVFLYGIGKELFNRKVGLISAGILAVDYISIRQIVSVMSETLFVAFLLLSFYCLTIARKRKSDIGFFGAGFFGGLSLLTREVLILYFPILAVWIYFQRDNVWKGRVLQTVFFLAGLMLSAGPWVVRNSFLYHHFVPITTTAGHTFYIANNPKTTGGSTGGAWEWDRDSYLPRDSGMKLFAPETDYGLFKKGMDFICRNPWLSIRLSIRKILNTWRPYQTDSSRSSRWITGGQYILIVILAFWGIIKTLDKWPKLIPFYLLLLYVFSLHAILIAEIRYRYPVMPFMMLFAALGLASILEKRSNLAA